VTVSAKLCEVKLALNTVTLRYMAGAHVSGSTVVNSNRISGSMLCYWFDFVCSIGWKRKR